MALLLSFLIHLYLLSVRFLSVKKNADFLTKLTSRSFDLLCLPKILQPAGVCPCVARHRPEYFVASLMGASFINRMCHERCLRPWFWAEFFHGTFLIAI